MLEFEWDPEKSAENQRKHGVSFKEAVQAFADPLSLTIHDPDHSESEDRYILLGLTSQQKLLVVVHTERYSKIRIISARPARARERRDYESSQRS